MNEYAKAFNAADESLMQNFFRSRVQPETLKQVPEGQRVDRYRQLKHDLTSVTVEEILNAAREEVKAVMHDANGNSLLFTFTMADKPPYGLLSIGVMMTDEPEQLGSKVSPPRTDEELVTMAKAIVDSLSSADACSGVVLIAKSGRPIFRVACGFADKEQKIFNTVDTKFIIGSVNKAFTSIVIHQLSKEGRLSLDDTIKKFLPSYPNVVARENVTVRHLLSMSSGIGDFFGERYQRTPKKRLARSTISSRCLPTSHLNLRRGRGASIPMVDTSSSGLLSKKSPDWTTIVMSGTTFSYPRGCSSLILIQRIQ